MEIAVGSATVSLPAVDVASLTQAARIDALVEVQRARAWADAAEQRLLAALVEPGSVPSRFRVSAAVEAKQYVREQIACALQVAPVTVNDKLHTARTLVATFPATLAALEAGTVTMRHARILVEAVQPLDEQARVKVEAHVLDQARRQTPTRFKQTDHDRLCARVAAAKNVAAVLDPGCAGCVSRARGADQRRADAFVSLLMDLDTHTVATRHGRRPSVQVSVALSTLLGGDEQPGELDGYGPIPAVLARRIAGDPSGTWRRLVTDPLGHLLDYGRSTYRPPQDLTDHVIARDRVCRFPGCGRQARTCEQDHLLDWDFGGHTAAYNMLAGCPRHHHLRHDAGWAVTGSPAGTLTWTTPTGHSYDDPLGEHPIETTCHTQPAATADPDPPPF